MGHGRKAHAFITYRDCLIRRDTHRVLLPLFIHLPSMIYSLTGTIIDRDKEKVAIETGNIGYEVFVSKPLEYFLDSHMTLYTYEVITQDDHYLVGFPTKREKEMFGMLISVKGIGPKTAITALGGTSVDELLQAIQSNNVSYLKKLPGIGPKAASQIILDLQGKLVTTSPKSNLQAYEEARLALKQLGFKVKEIDDALSAVAKPDQSVEETITLCLRKLRKS